MPHEIKQNDPPTPEPDTRQITERLVRIVAREAEHLDTLLQLLTAQQRFLVEGDLAEVEQNVQKQEEAIHLAGELEGERARLLKALAPQLDEQPQALSLARLSELLSGTYAQRIKQLRETLLSITGNIQRTRQQNEMLIGRSLYHVDETMRLIAGNDNTSPSYAEGKSAGGNGKPIVNRLG